jgi:protein dithiol:quinone oxidoreductase
MLKRFFTGKEGFYWLAMLVFGMAMEGTALIYQYVLNDPPCVLCIQVRLWVFLMMGLALVGWLVRSQRVWVALMHLLMAGAMAGILDRAWRLLGTERGFYIASCNFDLGLPSWFTPAKWFPSIFEVQASCGYTPELVFGITMSEFLLVMSACLLLLSMVLAIVVFISKPE